jgi:hypothetical protein
VFEAARPLENLRFVLTRPKRADKSPGQKAARKLLERSYRTFVTWYAELEAEERVASEGGAGAPVADAELPIEDAGAARVAALLEMKLGDLQRGEAG